MLGAMRMAMLAVVLFAIAGAGCKSDPPATRKLRKFEVQTAIDDRGRLKLAFRLFDAKHELMPVTGSYTGEVTKLDGTVLCKAAGEFAPADFSEKGTYQAPWHDAKCPADPGADELKVNVTLTAKGQGEKEKGKDEKAEKDEKGTADREFERSMTLPIKSLYERPPAKPPAAPAVSKTEPAAEKPAAAVATDKPATPATAEKPAEAPATPATAEKPTAAPAKPAEAPAKPAEAPTATGSGSAS